MTSPRLPNELDIVRDISVRLERGGVPFMLTGSLAMSYYAEPRMTRDVDIVIAVEAAEAPRIVTLLETDYYVDAAYRRLVLARSGAERLTMATRAFDAVRDLALASFPPGLPTDQVRQRLFARIYGDVSPERVPAALRGG